jgi:hypothetical protein
VGLVEPVGWDPVPRGPIKRIRKVVKTFSRNQGLDRLTGRSRSITSHSRSSARRRSRTLKGLAAWVVLGVAILKTFAVLLRVFRTPRSLFALACAFIGLQDLGGIRASHSKALGLASHIGIVALISAFLLRSRRVTRNSGGTGDSGGLFLGKSEDTKGEREDDGRVLHRNLFFMGR